MLATLTVLLPSCGAPPAAPPVPQPDRVHAMMSAEDARPQGRASLAPLLDGLEAEEPFLRRLAVRGLGRQERPDLVPDIRPLAEDADPEVRRAAIDALARAVSRSDPGPVIPALLLRLTRDPDPGVRATAATAFGRLPYADAAIAHDAAETLLRASRGRATGHTGEREVEPVEPETLVGVAGGIESLLRRQRDLLEPPLPLIDRLREIALGRDPVAANLPRARRLALRALATAGAADASSLATALADDDPQVRRIAAGAIPTASGDPAAIELVDTALADPAGPVRLEAAAAAARLPRELGCPRLQSLLRDENIHVVLRTLDGLGDCPDAATVLAAEAAGERDSWHRSAHALVALAGLVPGQARPLLREAMASDLWPVRMYAARAAARAGDAEALRELAGDTHPNVAEAALRGLSDLEGHGVHRWLAAALERDDYQLLITAADALARSPRGTELVPALLDALDRISRAERETSRDARLALLRRIEELGDDGHADRLLPYLIDFDPRVAELAAGILTGWTGPPRTARPEPLPRAPVPTPDELAELAESRAVIRMADGTELTLELFPWEAPTNAARFARLARAGYYDGLTFHRVVPNFVIQGGSPGANEYAGDGPYTRDELTWRPHLRGTVGVSTRGRDTGDGQIFVNLVDNPRLDHEYTIFARVIDGMDAVDDILEADRIDTIRFRSRADGAATPGG